MNLTVNMSVMNQGIAVRLISHAQTVGDIDYWWIETLFVHPETRLMAFNKHQVYKELHTRKVACH